MGEFSDEAPLQSFRTFARRSRLIFRQFHALLLCIHVLVATVGLQNFVFTRTESRSLSGPCRRAWNLERFQVILDIRSVVLGCVSVMNFANCFASSRGTAQFVVAFMIARFFGTDTELRCAIRYEVGSRG